MNSVNFQSRLRRNFSGSVNFQAVFSSDSVNVAGPLSKTATKSMSQPILLIKTTATPFQATLGMFSAFEEEFFKQCYYPLGDLMDDMALANSSINFFIYYFMSKQFRKNFLEAFRLTKLCALASQKIAAYRRKRQLRRSIAAAASHSG